MALRFTRREKSMLRSSRATVLAEISISSCRSSSAIPAGVLWVQRMPVMGSPAVSCSPTGFVFVLIFGGFFFPPFLPRRCGGGGWCFGVGWLSLCVCGVFFLAVFRAGGGVAGAAEVTEPTKLLGHHD